MDDFIITLLLTFKLAILTTFILFLISIPLAYFLAYWNFKLKPLIQAIISLPLVLPPTVIGYYLLVVFNSNGFLAKVFDLNLAFTFSGILIGSLIYSLPFMVNPIEAGFRGLPVSLKEASYSLGKSSFETIFKVLLPNIKIPLLTGAVLTFAHTIGEFGIVLMIGGGIPGKTKVASIAILNEVEDLNYSMADLYSIILFAISFIILIGVYLYSNQRDRAFL